MTASIIDGKAVAAQVEAETAAQIARLASAGITPGLAVVLVGDDPGSRAYVNMKERDCERLGIRSFDTRLPEETTQDELEAVVERFNADPDVHGVLVQLPLPRHLDEERVIELIAPAKDIDGFHPTNLGRLLRGVPAPRANTPWGIMRMLEAYGIDPTGKRAVVVGRSTIVGKPMALMLLEANATVTVAHSRTADLRAVCREAEILVVAIGRAEMIDASYIRPGAVVIDVGMNRGAESLTGDVSYNEVAEVASAITPVPGGVGPMTRAMLMANTVAAAAAAAGV